ncbi:MAG: hypothetical protein AVO39_05965 [delta proteobacterium MLS_D]|nr:MAG: hypothetical protein AVO39_05965 [delta proteobacterium MLS_D]
MVVIKLRSRFKPFDMQVSVAIATLSLVFLILLMAYAVKHAREQDRVRQFAERHTAIACTVAAGIEDTINGVRDQLSIFSRFVVMNNEDQAFLEENMRVLMESTQRAVRAVGMVNAEGDMLALWPSRQVDNEDAGNKWVRYFRDPAICEKITENPLVRFRKAGENAAGYAESAIGIRLPRYNEYGHCQGALLALLSLDVLLDRYTGPLRLGKSTENWLFAQDGTIMVHANPYVIGREAEVLIGEPEDEARWRAFLMSDEGAWGEFVIQDCRGEVVEVIVAVAPIRVGTDRLTIALITPYSVVVELMHKVFFNITAGAVGLIILLIVAGLSVGVVVTRQMRWEETKKRLQEREEWQSQLVREKKTVEGIIEGSPIPTMVIGKDHRIILWNRALAELTGYDSKDMIGTDRHYLPLYQKMRPLIADIIVDGNLGALDDYYGTKQVQKSKTVRDAYEAYDHFDNLGGKDRHLYFLAAPIYDEKGNIIAAIETLQDITREKELERSLTEYAETLQKELNANIKLREEIEGLYSYMQLIIDTLPEKIFDIDEEGIINYVSRENIADKKPIKGTHFLDFVDPENREFVLARWEDGKRGVFKPYQLEVTARDGSRRLLLITPRRIPGTRRVLLVQQDITEIRKLEKAIFDTEKLAALGHLSAGIAHELRNALSSIKMSLQILERRMGPEGNDLKRFKIAQREVEHLSQLVRDVLLYAKPADPEKEPTSVASIMEHSLAMVEKELIDKRITIQRHYDDDLPPIDVDPGMFSQSLLNLLLNAVDAVDEGGSITVSSSRSTDDHDSVTIEIADNGCGIDEASMSSLFNPFFSRKKYGTGLGLAQVKKIMDVHGGRIEIFSTSGEGTRIVLNLPVSERKA